MDKKPLIHAVEQQEWLDPAADATQETLSKIYKSTKPAGKAVQNALHGTWSGHPLHPALTDVPIGAWTVAWVFDTIEMTTGQRELRKGADAAIVVGLAAAVPTALSGATDWHVFKHERKIKRKGMAHALFNVGATVLLGTSFVLRRRGNRSAGMAVAMLGYLSATLGARLGGSLVYDEKVGVDHGQRDSIGDQFRPVIALDELGENQPHRVDVDGVRVLLVRRGNQVFAIGEQCSHYGGPLAEGEIEGDCIECPWHDSKFRLDTGEVCAGPATMPQPRFDVRIQDGQVELRMPGLDEPAKQPEIASRVQML